MWRKWDLRRSCPNYNLTLYQQSFVVLLLVSCNLHVTSEARAKHIPMFYTAKWMSDRAMQAYCQASHASSVMANYNWQLMLEDGQVQTHPDKITLIISVYLKAEHYPAISTHPEVRACHCSCNTSHVLNGTLTEHTAAPAIKESHKSSEAPDTLMSLCSVQPFVIDPTGPPGSSHNVGSDMGSLLFWVVNSVLPMVVACRLSRFV